jgi:hypothetical protein
VKGDGRFGVVQPYGYDPVHESTVVSVHATADAAFSEIDRLAAQMTRPGAPSDAVELLAIDFEPGCIVPRSNLQ